MGEMVAEWVTRRTERNKSAGKADPLLFAFEKLSESELRHKAAEWFPADDQKQLDKLLALNGEGRITPDQEEQLEALLDEVERIASESAAAKVILRQRINQGQ